MVSTNRTLINFICDLSRRGSQGWRVRGLSRGHLKKEKGENMSAQNKQLLIATINNLSDGSLEMFRELATLTDSELESILNEILQK